MHTRVHKQQLCTLWYTGLESDRMTESRRYYCTLRVDTTFNAGNLPKDNIKKINDSLEEVLEKWSQEMADKGLTTDIGWNWSEHVNL